jgi:hypothetical protein
MLLGEPCKLEFGYYPNKTVAITAIRISDDEPWCVPTVNYEQFFQGLNYRKQLCFPLVVIKNYSENAGVLQQLEEAGVITSGAYLSGTGGTVQSGLLSEEWQAFAKKELAAIRKNKIFEKFRSCVKALGLFINCINKRKP